MCHFNLAFTMICSFIVKLNVCWIFLTKRYTCILAGYMQLSVDVPRSMTCTSVILHRLGNVWIFWASKSSIHANQCPGKSRFRFSWIEAAAAWTIYMCSQFTQESSCVYWAHRGDLLFLICVAVRVLVCLRGTEHHRGFLEVSFAHCNFYTGLKGCSEILIGGNQHMNFWAPWQKTGTRV